MSPYPLDPADAKGPMRIVLCAFPSPEVADRVSREVLDRRLAACAQRLAVASRFVWKGRVEAADEALVLYKTAPKRVGALFELLRRRHPYEVPEIVELDVPRVHPPYLEYLAATIDPDAPPPPLGGGTTRRTPATRRGSRRARGARRPG